MEPVQAIRNGEGVRHAPGGQFHALVLAAGAGSRFGGGKLRALWRGRPLIEWAVSAAKAAPVDGVTLLVQRGARPIDDGTVGVIEVADWAEGMAASLRAGIAALPDDCAGAFVFLGDMPAIPVQVLAPLAAAVRDDALAAAPEYEGQLGHPVLLSRALFAEVARLKGDRGARPILERLGDRLARIATSAPGVLFDVDRPEDLDGP